MNHLSPLDPDNEIHVAIISSGRADSVPRMESACSPLRPVWYVGIGEGGEYRYAGAERVVEVEGNLSEARNSALDDGFSSGKVVVQLSDDLKWFKYKQHGIVERISVRRAIHALLDMSIAHKLPLAGISMSSNPFFNSGASTTHLPVVGDFLVIHPSEPRFDPRLRLSEDYDFCLQHMECYGGAVRVSAVIGEFSHRTNRGGAVAYRHAVPSGERESVDILCEKWPQKLFRTGAESYRFVREGKGSNEGRGNSGRSAPQQDQRGRTRAEDR